MTHRPPEEPTEASSPLTLRSLTGDSLVFGLGRLMAVLASLILVPIYTRFFTVADYGLIENLNILVALLVGLFGLGLPEALFRHFPYAVTAVERRNLLVTCSRLSLGSGVIAILAALASARWFGGMFLLRPAAESLGLVTVASLLAFATIQLTLLLGFLRISMRRKEYLVAALGGLTASLALSILCVVGLGLGASGPFIGSACGASLAYIFFTGRNTGLLSRDAFDWGVARRLLSFGLPLVPVSMFLLIIRSSDRYFISLLLPDPLHQVGLYTTAEKVLAPLALVASGFALAWTPFAMHAGRQDNAATLFRKALGYYVTVTSLGAIVLAAVSRAVLVVLTPAEYRASYVYVPVLGLYAAISALHYIGSVGLLLSNQTRLGVPIVGAAAVANLVLNAALIPHFGVFGAAWATVGAFVVYNLLMFATSERLVFVGFPIWRAGAAYTVGYLAAEVSLGRPLLGLVALVAQAGVLLALRLVEPSILTDTLSKVRRGLGAR